MTDAGVEEGVVFATVEGGRELLCAVHRPAGDAQGVVILLHGGGWRMGSPASMTELAELLAARGWWAVRSEYRLLPEAGWPAQIRDVQSAIRWARASTDRFGTASEVVTLVGSSAGAHLALLATATGDTGTFGRDEVNGASDVSDRVDAVAAFFPPVRVGGDDDARGDRARLGVDEAGAAVASPITYARASFPPTLLLHGTGDTMVHHAESVAFFDALSAHGAPVDLRLYHNQPHGFAVLPGMAELVCDDIARFLDRHLAHRKAFEVAQEELQARWDEPARTG